jgi:hypothetical protein
MKCSICPNKARERSRYCALCADHVMSVPEGRARVAALKRARRPDGFHCEYSGALLSLTDTSDPFYLHFDHRTPGVKNDLAATGALINQSKTNLTWQEFPAVVREAVTHWDTGAPFRRDVVPFAAWLAGKQAIRPTNELLVEQAMAPQLLTAAYRIPGRSGGRAFPNVQLSFRLPKGSERMCRLCEKYAIPPRYEYCPRCQPLFRRRLGEKSQSKFSALKASFVWERDVFTCHHLGVELDLFDWTSPYYMWFDHLTPRKKGDLVVSSRLANETKKDLDEQEYRAFFRELDKAFRGGTFDRNAFTTKYWKRPKYEQ